MLNDNNRQYVSWGITALVVVVLSLLLSFFISRFGAVRSFAASILNILMPVIYGALMAFLMAPAYNTVCGALVPFLAEKVFRRRKGRRQKGVQGCALHGDLCLHCGDCRVREHHHCAHHPADHQRNFGSGEPAHVADTRLPLPPAIRELLKGKKGENTSRMSSISAGDSARDSCFCHLDS